MIAYHEAGHALVARLMSEDIHKVTIVPRGRALGFMMSLPEEDRYVLSKDELEDWLKVTLAGRAAEQVVFGRITNGAANDLDRATAIARSMVFDWGMGRDHRRSRCAPTTTRCPKRRKRHARRGAARDHRRRRTPRRVRLVSAHRRHLDVLAQALLDKETLDREEHRPSCSRASSQRPTRRGQIGVELPREDVVRRPRQRPPARAGAAGAGLPRAAAAGQPSWSRRGGGGGRLGHLFGVALHRVGGCSRGLSGRSPSRTSAISCSLAAI